MPTIENLRYPANTDTPDVPRDMLNLATDVAARTPRAYAMGTAATPAGGSVAVTFPVGRFTNPPQVALAIIANAMPASVCQAYTSTPTASGFTLRCHSTAGVGGGALTVSWIALED